MEVITSNEIINLYRKCGLDATKKCLIRTEINTGTLSNKLYVFLIKILYKHHREIVQM